MFWPIDTCPNKVSTDQCHVTISQAQVLSSSRSREFFFWSWLLTKCWFSIGSPVHVRLTCCKQGRIVRKPLNANPGLKVNRIINFSLYTNVFHCFCFVYFEIIHTQNRRPNNIQKTSPQSYKTQIKILAYPGLASSGSEQPGPGVFELQTTIW